MMSLRKAYDARDDLMFDEDEEQEEELDEEPEHGKVRLTPAEKDLECLQSRRWFWRFYSGTGFRLASAVWSFGSCRG